MTESTGCDCAKLDDRNQKKRSNIKTKSGKESKSKAVAGAKDANGVPTGEGTTVSSMCFQPPGGGTKVTSAHNSQKALANTDNGFVEGQDMAKRETGESNLCPEANHTHATPYKQKSGHTEARLLDERGKQGFPPGSTLTLKIDWRPSGKGGDSSPMPCTDCHKLLCAAKKCKVNVFLCDEKNEKKELTEEHCDENDGYKKLQDTLQPPTKQVP